MLSTVPVPRLLDGIADSLRANVAPFVDDKFALMQLRAVDELLRNLAQRVDWDPTAVVLEAEDWRGLLSVFARAGWPGQVPSPALQLKPTAAAIEYRHDVLTLVRGAMDWLVASGARTSERAAALAAFKSMARRTNTAERERLKSGMYRPEDQ